MIPLGGQSGPVMSVSGLRLQVSRPRAISAVRCARSTTNQSASDRVSYINSLWDDSAAFQLPAHALDMAQSTARQVFQPIHPEMVPKLLPEYVEFHNANTAFVPPVQTLPWDPAVRKNPPVAGGSTPLKVGSVRDVPLSNCKVRVFTPEGEVPEGGWPVFIFFHGGKLSI